MLLRRRNRTSSPYIFYALHLYFLGLSLRKTSKCLSDFVRRNHVSIWNWIQHYNPEKLFHTKRRIYDFIVDETLIKVVGGEFVWLWIASEPKDKTILGIHISYERRICLLLNTLYIPQQRNMENILFQLIVWYMVSITSMQIPETTTPHIYSPYEKSIIERTIQYVKDRTENFDDYFPCRKEREVEGYQKKQFLPSSITLTDIRQVFLGIDIHLLDSKQPMLHNATLRERENLRRRKYTIKLSLGADLLKQIICIIKIRRAPTRHYNIDFRLLIAKITKILPTIVISCCC